MNVVQSALSSRRLNRWLPWIAAAVLAAGVITFLMVYVGNTAKVSLSEPAGSAIPAAKTPKNIPFPQAAWRVAREFLFTAVSRKHLAESYAISDPTLRGGFTLRQWKTGTIPVTFFPVASVQKTNWKNTNYAHPRDAQINVILTPAKHSSMRPMIAQIGLTKIGSGSNARWMVSYFGPLSGPPVPHP